MATNTIKEMATNTIKEMATNTIKEMSNFWWKANQLPFLYLLIFHYTYSYMYKHIYLKTVARTLFSPGAYKGGAPYVCPPPEGGPHVFHLRIIKSNNKKYFKISLLPLTYKVSLIKL